MQTAAKTKGAVKSTGEYSGHGEVHWIWSAFTSLLVTTLSSLNSWSGTGISGQQTFPFYGQSCFQLFSSSKTLWNIFWYKNNLYKSVKPLNCLRLAMLICVCIIQAARRKRSQFGCCQQTNRPLFHIIHHHLFNLSSSLNNVNSQILNAKV